MAFSITATVLITIGWARRRKLEEEVEFVEPELEEIAAATTELVPTAEPPVLGAEEVSKAEETVEAATEAVPAAPVPPPRLKPSPRRKAAPRARAAPARKRSGAAPTRAAKVVVIPGRGRYHTARCRFSKTPGAERVTAVTARRRGLRPCSVCDPPV